MILSKIITSLLGNVKPSTRDKGNTRQKGNKKNVQVNVSGYATTNFLNFNNE